MRALECLNYLGALDDEGDLTDKGRRMSMFPLQPEMAACVLSSAKYGSQTLEDVLTVVSLLSVPPVFQRPKESAKHADAAHSQFKDRYGDHISLINVYDAYTEAKRIDGKADDFCYQNFLSSRSLRQCDSVRWQLSSICERLSVASRRPLALAQDLQGEIVVSRTE